MSTNRILAALAFLTVAGVSALMVVLLAWDRGGEPGAEPETATLPGEIVPSTREDPGSAAPDQLAPPAEGSPGLEARATLSPRIIFFGDTMRALFDVTLDRDRVDPDSVQVAVQLAPWEIVGTPRRDRKDAGKTTHLRWTYTLRCLTSPCVPPRATAPLEFSSARVSYAASSAETAERRSIEVEFPLLVVYSRYTASSFEGTDEVPVPWRADVNTLPAVSYRVSPNLALALLLAASGLLVATAVVLAYLAWPHRAPSLPPEPEPEPVPSLTPLEQALALLDETVRTDEAGDQRRALELVSEALEEWGDEELAGAARVLAWSERVPEVKQTTALAARVRAELERELLERAELDQNGAGSVV